MKNKTCQKDLRGAKVRSMGWRRHSTKRQMEVFGQRVKRFRAMAGMTQPQLAKAMQVSLRTVQNIEWAKNEPRYTTINKFNRLQQAHIKSVTTGFTEALNDGVMEHTHV